MLPPHNRIPLERFQQDVIIRNKPKPKRNGLLVLFILAGMAAVFWKGMMALDHLLPEAEAPLDIAPIAELHPIVAAKQAELIARTADIGITIVVTDGMRTTEEQNALYEQGRSASGSIVTNVKGGHSYHNYGLAIDFALRPVEDNKQVIWDMEYDGNGNGQSDWMEVVAIAKELGFSWGGDWQGFRDYPHLQMDFGYSIRELRKGKQPPME